MTAEITAAATATIRNFFYVNPAKPTSVSMAFVTATTVGKVTTYTYTNREMTTVTIDRAGFEVKWNAGYFTATPASRMGWFAADGKLIRTREMVGQSARKADAPALPKF